jgi:glycosyltransferase involved in cell wall biosynthesis
MLFISGRNISILNGDIFTNLLVSVVKPLSVPFISLIVALSDFSFSDTFWGTGFLQIFIDIIPKSFTDGNSVYTINNFNTEMFGIVLDDRGYTILSGIVAYLYYEFHFLSILIGTSILAIIISFLDRIYYSIKKNSYLNIICIYFMLNIPLRVLSGDQVFGIKSFIILYIGFALILYLFSKFKEKKNNGTLFIIGTLSNGGAEKVVSNLSLELYKEENIKIILFGKNDKIDYDYLGELIYLDKKSPKTIIGKVSYTILRILKLLFIKIKYINFNHVSFLEYPNILNLSTKINNKTFLSVRNHMSTKHKSGLASKIVNLSIKLFYNRANKIIAVSEIIKKDLIDNYKIKSSKISVIYNFYDIEKISELKTQSIDETIDFDNFDYIITVGRIEKQKNHRLLLMAFSELKKKQPQLKLLILGEGSLKDEMELLVKTLKIENEVVFIGFNKNPYKYISKSKVFVLSSLFEGFPNSLVEAMSCGIPVIATDCLSGPREILAPKEIDTKNFDYENIKGRFGLLCRNDNFYDLQIKFQKF